MTFTYFFFKIRFITSLKFTVEIQNVISNTIMSTIKYCLLDFMEIFFLPQILAKQFKMEPKITLVPFSGNMCNQTFYYFLHQFCEMSLLKRSVIAKDSCLPSGLIKPYLPPNDPYMFCQNSSLYFSFYLFKVDCYEYSKVLCTGLFGKSIFAHN